MEEARREPSEMWSSPATDEEALAAKPPPEVRAKTVEEASPPRTTRSGSPVWLENVRSVSSVDCVEVGAMVTIERTSGEVVASER